MARPMWWWMDVTPSLPLQEETVVVNGFELFYRTGGSGPPLLLLHGFTQIGQLWAPFLDELGKHYTVIVPDLPGHGRSARPSGDFMHREVARSMFVLMDSLGVERVRGIGHSSGGIVLIHMAVQRPERLGGIVLVAGAHRLLLDNRVAMRERAGRWDELTLAVHAQQLRRHPGGEEQSRWIAAQSDRFGDEYGDFDLSPEHLSTILTDTLLVWGDRDPQFPVEFALELYRALPRAALWVIPGRGHRAVWESEEAISTFPRVVHKFFQGELVG